MILATLVLIVSIDNKASWFGLTCSLALVLAKLDLLKGRMLKIVAPVIFVILFGLGIAFVAKHTSGSIAKFSGIAEAVRTGSVSRLGKIKAYFDILKLYKARPVSIIVGAGPSNFYSRASMLFYLDAAGLQKMYANPGLLKEGSLTGDAERASSSMGGILSKTIREPYYLRFYSADEQIFAIGSGQVDTPFSPYAGLLGESGLLGFALYVGIYGIVTRRIWKMMNRYEADPDIFPMLTSTCGFLIYILCNSFYGPFLETTRYTTILWSMIALIFIYEARSTQEEEEDESSSMLIEQPSVGDQV